MPDDPTIWRAVAGVLAIALISFGAALAKGAAYLTKNWRKEFAPQGHTDNDSGPNANVGLRETVELLRTDISRDYGMLRTDLGAIRSDVADLRREQLTSARETRDAIRDNSDAIGEVGERLERVEEFLAEKHGFKK